MTGASYENIHVRDPTSPDTVVESPALRPVPMGTLHFTLDSDFHGVDAHEVLPILIVGVKSTDPNPDPKTSKTHDPAAGQFFIPTLDTDGLSYEDA
jgi:hypothetical protein